MTPAFSLIVNAVFIVASFSNAAAKNADDGRGKWLERFVFQPYAFRNGRRPTKTRVALSRADYSQLNKDLHIGTKMSGVYYHGLKINFKGDPESMILYVNRSCCALDSTTIAKVRTFPPHTWVVHVAAPLVIADVSIGTSRERVLRHFGYAPLVHGQLRYEQSPRPGTDTGSHCATRYTFTFWRDQVVAMDFDNEC